MEQHESRRHFLKQAGIVTATGAVVASGAVPFVHAAENNTIKLALIGAGGRGRGAAINALAADRNTKLWSIADPFPGRAAHIAGLLKAELESQDRADAVDVSPERAFDDLQGYKAAMDTLDPGDVVLITGPTGFRPLHYAYAVEKGLNIFAEKALAADVPGLKSLEATNKIAIEKGLKVAVGLNNRHFIRTEETIRAIHAGQLGELYSFFVYRAHGPWGIGPRGDLTPLQHQLRRIILFNWLSGGYVVDCLIHNLDICSWAQQQLPSAALGMGGRLQRRSQDDFIDNSSVQYFFPNGKAMHMYALAMDNVWGGFRAVIHGEKGICTLGEMVGDPRFEEWESGRVFWAPEAQGNDSYQTQHDRFFRAIRENTEWNEMQRGIDATLTAIMGRMANETGQRVTREQAWASTFQYAPNIAELTMESDSPFMPDENGDYPIPVPGRATINNPYA